MALGLPHSLRNIRQLRWRELLEFHRTHRDLTPARAARVALGISAPLLIGAFTGDVKDGIFAALGALPAGLVSFQGVNRSRFEAVLVASVGIAFSTFVGATMPGSWILQSLVIALWAYVAGLSVALGTLWGVVGINWAVAVLLGEAIPLPPGPAAVRSGFALAGGLFQGMLVALSWTLRPGRGERKALADSYALLAGYATEIGSGQVEAPSPSELPAAVVLQDPNPLIPPDVLGMYIDLLEEAVRLRASLAAVASYGHDVTESEVIRRFAAQLGTALDRVAAGLRASPGEWATLAEDARRNIASISVPQDARWRWAGEALLGQLRAVTRILVRIEAPAVALRVRVPGGHLDLLHPVSWLATSVATLRANMTSTTEAGRHALRLAVAASVAALVANATGYVLGRWVVLTVLLVLKPDYASTVGRSVQRAIGTLVGAGLIVALSQWMHAGPIELSAGAVVAIALAYVTFDVNYLVFSLFVTAFVLLILQLLGLAPLRLAEDRIGGTAIGAAWALIVYLAWPTWMGTSARETFAVLIERAGAYLVTILEQLAHPERVDPVRLQRVQEAARRARSDADAAADRLLREPSHPPLTADLIRGLMAVSARLVLGMLAANTLLDQRVAASMTQATSARLDALTSAFNTAFGQLAATMRTGSSLELFPPLRALQRALEEQDTGDPSLLVVTDALVDSAGSIAALLGRAFERSVAGSVARASS